jgi:hypothetical protein
VTVSEDSYISATCIGTQANPLILRFERWARKHLSEGFAESLIELGFISKHQQDYIVDI